MKYIITTQQAIDILLPQAQVLYLCILLNITCKLMSGAQYDLILAFLHSFDYPLILILIKDMHYRLKIFQYHIWALTNFPTLPSWYLKEVKSDHWSGVDQIQIPLRFFKVFNAYFFELSNSWKSPKWGLTLRIYILNQVSLISKKIIPSYKKTKGKMNRSLNEEHKSRKKSVWKLMFDFEGN